MGLIKPDFLRFFVLGFGAGAVLVFGMTDRDISAELGQLATPSVQAAQVGDTNR